MKQQTKRAENGTRHMRKTRRRREWPTAVEKDGIRKEIQEGQLNIQIDADETKTKEESSPLTGEKGFNQRGDLTQ